MKSAGVASEVQIIQSLKYHQMSKLFLWGREIWHIFLRTQVIDVLVIPQMHVTYKWDIVRKEIEQAFQRYQMPC